MLLLSAGQRWLTALAVLVAALAVWLETTAPMQPLPGLLAGVAASGLLCGPLPGAALAVAEAAAIWWFALRDLYAGGDVLLWFGGASAALLAMTAALRRWTNPAD